jgi:integrase
MTKTRQPGVYKRGGRYVVVYRDSLGKQRKESARTFDDARRLKARRDSEVASGALDLGRSTKFADYAREWIDEYRGRRTVIRDRTRREYARQMEDYTLTFFPNNKKLGEVTPRDVDRLVGWMLDGAKKGRPLSSSTIRRVLVPLRGCLESARREGLLVSNPCDGVQVPEQRSGNKRSEVKALSRQELKALIAEVPEEHRLFVELLAFSGMRWSEAIAVKKSDLDPMSMSIHVRRSAQQGREQDTKTAASVREIHLPKALFGRLQDHAERLDERSFLFTEPDGKMLGYPRYRATVLKPAASRIGASWVGFHTFRHTAASLLFASGRNVKEVQEFLGHASPGFTLSTYIHLIDKSDAPVVEL